MGLLDAPGRAAARQIIKTFASTPSQLKRTRTYRDEQEIERTEVIDVVVLVSPGINYNTREVQASSVESGDLQVFVAALDLEDADLENDPKFGTPQPHTDILIRPDGQSFQIVRVLTIESGDLPAAYELAVRKA